MTRLPVPHHLTHDELVEWFAGAGFNLAATVNTDGWLSQVFVATDYAGGDWPTVVGVVTNPAGKWSVTDHAYVAPVYDEVHEYADDCDCDGCVEARDEDAALRKVGM